MIGLLRIVLAVVTSPLKSRLRLEAENAALRHQLMVLRRRLQGHEQGYLGKEFSTLLLAGARGIEPPNGGIKIR
jgi:hypothetical protein